jgi:hypothetical protein
MRCSGVGASRSGFVALLFVHEIGHVVVVQRAQGVKASVPMFIPFLGAFIKVEEQHRSVAEVVSHRFSTVTGADLILVMAGGRHRIMG